MKKIKLNKEELSENKISAEVFEFLNSNELGTLYGGDSPYSKTIYINYVDVAYPNTTYVNTVPYPNIIK